MGGRLNSNPHDDGTSTDLELAIQKYLRGEKLPYNNAFFDATYVWTTERRAASKSEDICTTKKLNKLLALEIPSVILERRDGKQSIKFLRITKNGLELRDIPEAESDILTNVKLARDDKYTNDREVCDEHIVKVLVDGKPCQWEPLYLLAEKEPLKGVKQFKKDVPV